MKVLLIVLGFMWWWPLGLAALAYLAARGQLGCWRRPYQAGDAPMGVWDHRMDRFEHKVARAQEKVERMRSRMERWQGRGAGGWFTPGPSSSGNAAFDEYRAETLRRLEDEQREFKDFLDRLRVAKDRAEFDQFMTQRRQPPVEPGPAPETPHG